MKKYEIVKERYQFDNIIEVGKCIKNKYYVINYISNDLSFSRFGIAVGKKTGNAIVRNKIKRQLRMIINNNKNLFSKSKDYIIIVKRNILELSYQDMEKYLIKLIETGDL